MTGMLEESNNVEGMCSCESKGASVTIIHKMTFLLARMCSIIYIYMCVCVYKIATVYCLFYFLFLLIYQITFMISCISVDNSTPLSIHLNHPEFLLNSSTTFRLPLV